MINAEEYIVRQMQQRGIEIGSSKLINIIVRRITNANGTVTLNSATFEAYNQFWFLINANELPIGTRITSDTNVVYLETNSNELIEEFWGKIEIQLPQTFTGSMCQAIFYQVLPK